MTVRKIVQIDEEKCNGCGECVPHCEEGAIQVVDGKARLIKEDYCDGLGDCLGTCPQDAITVVEREARPFDPEAVERHLRESGEDHAHAHAGCPGAAMMDFGGRPEDSTPGSEEADQAPSALRQWPVQLGLVPPHAPFLDGADLLLAADCVPFAHAGFHQNLLAGKQLLIGCPKLDDAERYVQKLTEVFRQNEIRSLTVAHMEVPCCYGLVAIVKRALEASGADVPAEEVTVSVRGDIEETAALTADPTTA